MRDRKTRTGYGKHKELCTMWQSNSGKVVIEVVGMQAGNKVSAGKET